MGLSEPEETEPTFEGNAKLKALVAAKGANLPALATTGIEVDLLVGRRGLFARWAGPTKDFSIAMERCTSELAKSGVEWALTAREFRIRACACLA